jgi:hypothetical protein
MIWRNSLQARIDRQRRRVIGIVRSVDAQAPRDVKHCLAVLRANGGHGFPNLYFPAARGGAEANNLPPRAA